MQKYWLMACVILSLCLCSGCAQSSPKPSGQSQPHEHNGASQPRAQSDNREQAKPRAQSNTPDLAGGPERTGRKPTPMSLADLRKKYSTTFILSGTSTKREIALTFDDAPDANFTPKVLDVLKREGVKATFFVVGNRVAAHPDIVNRMVAEGHVLGNHSYTHANFKKLKDPSFRNEMTKADDVIRMHSGYVPHLVRPPYGNVTEEQIKWLHSQHKTMVGWNVDSLDWKGLSAEQVATNVLAHVRHGSIILQHAAGGEGEDLTGTIQALPRIIKDLRKDGVKLVTVPELLGVSP